LLLLITLITSLFTGCFNKNQDEEIFYYTSFRDVPGLTAEDIEAVEELLSRRDSFSYAMMYSTSAFVDANGEIRGYSALMCEWLTELFGVPFILEHVTWHELLDGLENGSIDFTGTITPTQERRLTYFMTDPIAQRSIMYFRLAGSEPVEDIVKERLPRYALLEGAVSAGNIIKYAIYDFEPVFVAEYIEAYELLVSGEVDALLAENTAEAIFEKFNDIVTTPFFPLLYTPVSMTAQNPELEPIIKVIQRILETGGKRYLDELFDEGYREYSKHSLFSRLSDEEINFIRDNPAIPFGAEYANYPFSFYNTRYGEWQGIAFDVLAEVTELTGMKFEVYNDQHTQFYDLLDMLIEGRIYLITEVIQTPGREGLYIWPENTLTMDRPVLISKVTYPNINMNRVYSARVGLSRGSAYTEFFFTWFPNHENYTIYYSQQATFDALINGEIDLVMNSYSTLLNLINYREMPDYKANILFDYSYPSTFGINREQVILCGIIDKSLALIDTEIISEHWKNRTYDYQLRLMQAQRPWIIGATGLLLCVLILVAMLLVRSRQIGKRMERLVEERTRKLELETATLTTLFDSIPDIIFTKDLNLRFINCNKSFLEYFGKQKSEIIGNTVTGALGFPGEMFGEEKVIGEGKAFEVEELVPRYDGEYRLYETKKIPLVLNGENVGLLGIARDVTKRKEIEQSIAFSYEYAGKLSDALAKITKSPTISFGDLKSAADIIAKEGCSTLEVSGVGLWRLSECESYLECVSHYNNRGEYEVFGDYDLASRRNYDELLRTERLIIMNNPKECEIITYSTGSKGDSNLCAALDAPIRIEGKSVGVVCVEQEANEKYPDKREWLIEEKNFTSSLADLMALAISGSERRKAREEAEIANKSKSSFLANVSHEIRTPMNAILGITEILIQHEKLPADVEEGLLKIYNSCDMLLGIINDILDFSKTEAGKLDIIPAEYTVASLINDAVQLNIMRIESKPIEFVLDIDENIPAKLIGDELRIKQILNNLLSNAFKYTDSGVVGFSVTSKPAPDEKKVVLEFNVKDSGRGMTPEQIEKLFDEYSRFDNNESTVRIEGTGLGLAITQRLINLMDGEIDVTSTYGTGSSFTVRIPQVTVDGEVLGSEVADNLKYFRVNNFAHSKISQVIRDVMPYGKVLVVDDVDTNLYVASGLMKPYELRIDTATSGHEAVEKVNSGKVYDIIFMDHMMPGMDGVETTKKLRESGYSEPIVALSANAVAGQAEIFLNNGFDDFISKPVDVRQLNIILNKFVRDKQPPEVIEAAHRIKTDTTDTYDFLSKVDSELLKSFVKDAHKAISVIKELYNRNEFDSSEADILRFTTHAHGIKSSLWNIGEKELSKEAAKLEHEGREKNTDLIISSIPAFLSELTELSDKIESMQTKTGGSGLNLLSAEVAGLDIKRGVEKYNNDEEVYFNILRSYVASTRSMLDIIEHVSEENLRDYEIKVHGIKGTSRDMFAEEIGAVAAELEKAAKNGDLDYIRENNPAFIESLKEFISRLDTLISGIDAENPRDKKAKPDEDILSNLFEACKMYDMSGADEAMEKLRKYEYEAQEDNELIKWLGDKYDMTKFDDIAEKLSSKLKK
jgi:PAS domain S-box-containing protein